MAYILDQLHADHINVVKLLNLFDQELELLEGCDSEPDYFKWQNILLYMTTYQDVFHHPTEEKLFAYVAADDPEVRQAIKEVESQHEMLYQKSITLQEMLMNIETKFIALDGGKLVDLCKDYIRSLQKHMSLEETVIFPFFRSKMNEGDWVNFEKEVNQIDDPLFGVAKRAEFTELYQCICEQ